MIEVHSSGELLGGQNVHLNADDNGAGNLDAKAKGTNWMSSIGMPLTLLLDQEVLDIGPGTGFSRADGLVINDGLIQTGQNRQKKVVISEGTDSNGDHYYLAQSLTSDDQVKSQILFTRDSSAGTLSGYVKTVTPYSSLSNPAAEYNLDFDLSINFESVPSQLYDQYEQANENLNRYRVKDLSGNYLNPDLITFYEDEIDRITAEMLARGEAVQVGDDIEPMRKVVAIASVAPITAAAGYIQVRADRLEGSGTFDSPKDVTLEIISTTSAFLEIQGAVVLDISGAVIFNDIDASEQGSSAAANAKIHERNEVADGYDNNFGDANDYGGLAAIPTISYDAADVAFTFTDATFSTSAPLPKVLIEVAHDAVLTTLNRDGGGSFDLQVWPSIYITGDVLNLRGDVVIDNNSQVSVDRGGLTAIATLRDATVGDVSSLNAVAADKTNGTISVSDIVVSESDSHAIFTVSGAAGTSVQLELNGGSATLDTDISSSLEISTNGSSWSSYTDGTATSIGSSGKLYARTAITQDTNIDDAETFMLVVALSSGSTERLDYHDKLGSSKGDIKVSDGVKVNARNIYQRTGGTLFIGGPNSDLIYHINGDEYAKWRTASLTGSGTLNGGTENANTNGGVASYLAEEPSTSSPAIEAARVYIDVASLNINGVIKSGEDTFSVNLDSNTKADIDYLRRTNSGRMPSWCVRRTTTTKFTTIQAVAVETVR